MNELKYLFKKREKIIINKDELEVITLSCSIESHRGFNEKPFIVNEQQVWLKEGPSSYKLIFYRTINKKADKDRLSSLHEVLKEAVKKNYEFWRDTEWLTK